MVPVSTKQIYYIQYISPDMILYVFLGEIHIIFPNGKYESQLGLFFPTYGKNRITMLNSYPLVN
jgi:hypothetical protein